MLTTSHTFHCHEVNELISPQVELLQIAKYFEICIKEKGKRSRKRKNQCKGKKKKKTINHRIICQEYFKGSKK